MKLVKKVVTVYEYGGAESDTERSKFQEQGLGQDFQRNMRMRGYARNRGNARGSLPHGNGRASNEGFRRPPFYFNNNNRFNNGRNGENGGYAERKRGKNRGRGGKATSSNETNGVDCGVREESAESMIVKELKEKLAAVEGQLQQIMEESERKDEGIPVKEFGATSLDDKTKGH